MAFPESPCLFSTNPVEFILVGFIGRSALRVACVQSPAIANLAVSRLVSLSTINRVGSHGVLWRELVAMNAMRLDSVVPTSRIVRVLKARCWSEMRRPYARWVAATVMVKLHAIRDRADEVFITPPMSEYPFTTRLAGWKSELAVALLVLATGPDPAPGPAPAYELDLRHEAVDCWPGAWRHEDKDTTLTAILPRPSEKQLCWQK